MLPPSDVTTDMRTERHLGGSRDHSPPMRFLILEDAQRPRHGPIIPPA